MIRKLYATLFIALVFASLIHGQTGIKADGTGFNFEILPLAIEAESEVKIDLQEFFTDHSKIIIPETEIVYHIRIVTPDPSIDYKILKIDPDPNIDYKIRIIEPKTRRELIELSPAISEKMKDLLKKMEESKSNKEPEKN